MKLKSIENLFGKKIPAKNYIIVLVVSLLVIVVSLYARTFYLNYRENARNTTVFHDKTIKQVNTEDIGFALSEMSEAILYVSYTGDSDIHDIEKKLLKEIKKQNLIEKIVYWDVTNLLDNNEYLKILKEKYPSIEEQITAAPLFLYVKGGEPIEAMSSELKNIDVNVFNKLIETYDIE